MTPPAGPDRLEDGLAQGQGGLLRRGRLHAQPEGGDGAAVVIKNDGQPGPDRALVLVRDPDVKRRVLGDTPCLTAADDSGYEIDEAEVIYE